MLYFDHNATSPLLPVARNAWLAASAELIGNPSSPHRLGRRAEVALEDARARLARHLACQPHDIIWTSGATEAVNTALHHLSHSAGTALLSPLEHPCVLQAAALWFGTRVRTIPLLSTGALDLNAVERLLENEAIACVAIMAANNETGALQPWRAVSEFCREHRTPLLCDAAQWIGKLPARGLGACDFVSGCAHKFGGPPGVGFLKVSGALRPLLAGGGQEEGRRSGTENVPGVLAMMAALDARENAFSPANLEEKHRLRSGFTADITRDLGVSQVVAAEEDTLWNTVSMILPEIDCRQRWVVKLDKLGFAVSTGSACASGKEKPSHVLSALGLSPALASRVIRFSSSWETTASDWAALASGIREAFAQLRGTA